MKERIVELMKSSDIANRELGFNILINGFGTISNDELNYIINNLPYFTLPVIKIIELSEMYKEYILKVKFNG